MILAPVGTGRGSITSGKCEKTLVGCVYDSLAPPMGVEENDENE